MEGWVEGGAAASCSVQQRGAAAARPELVSEVDAAALRSEQPQQQADALIHAGLTDISSGLELQVTERTVGRWSLSRHHQCLCFSHMKLKLKLIRKLKSLISRRGAAARS